MWTNRPNLPRPFSHRARGPPNLQAPAQSTQIFSPFSLSASLRRWRVTVSCLMASLPRHRRPFPTPGLFVHGVVVVPSCRDSLCTDFFTTLSFGVKTFASDRGLHSKTALWARRPPFSVLPVGIAFIKHALAPSLLFPTGLSFARQVFSMAPWRNSGPPSIPSPRSLACRSL